MVWGISPRKIAVIPLGDYNADHYLTLLYHAFENLGWHTGYFNHDGIIAYTNISWESYAEEVSVRIVNNQAIIKSECVGYQGLFTDYGKNEKNLELLLGEITYVEYHLQHNLEQTVQELMNLVPENQFINLNEPPMAAKEKLQTFFSAFAPTKNYFVTPLLVLVNTTIFIVTMMVIFTIAIIYATRHDTGGIQNADDIYLALGFSGRNAVLNGQVWRLITNTFLHFSLLHLAGNMIVLIYIGSLLEGKLGKWTYLLLYLSAGVCASITSVIWHDNAIAAGASGAIFGLFGILLALLSTNFYENNARRALLISTGIFVGYNIIPIRHSIDHAAHFGGLVSGYIFGWLSYLGLKYRKQSYVVAGALGITTLYTGLCLQFAPRYDFKSYVQLFNKNQILLDSLNHYFYGRDNMDQELSHVDRLALVERKGLPRIKQLKELARKIDNVSLPKNQKQIAHVKSKLIWQESVIFDLLYKEMCDQNPTKYRPVIISTTDSMNKLRMEWGDLQEKLDRDNQ